jgi:small subunit ribosomal protein S16
MGKNKRPFYRIVAADQRSPRNGKFIEIVGHYDPLADPHVVEIKEDRIFYWLEKGAQPSDTVRSLLKRKGLLYRLHLRHKGLAEEQIMQELEKWMELQELRRKRREAQKIKKKAQKKKKRGEEKAEKVAKEVTGEKVEETATPEEVQAEDQGKAEETAKEVTGEKVEETATPEEVQAEDQGKAENTAGEVTGEKSEEAVTPEEVQVQEEKTGESQDGQISSDQAKNEIQDITPAEEQATSEIGSEVTVEEPLVTKPANVSEKKKKTKAKEKK